MAKSLLKTVGDFLFGRDPDIFNEAGDVVHKHPKKKWDAWINRMKTDPHMNWRNHTGTLAGQKNPPSNQNS